MRRNGAKPEVHLSEIVIASVARHLLLLALERPLVKRQVAHRLKSVCGDKHK